VAFLLAAVLIWAARRVSLIAWLVAGMLALASLFLTTTFYPVGQPGWMPMWVYWTWNLLPAALPALALILAAALSYSALRRTSRAPEAGPASGRSWPALLLAVFLIVKALHNL
jgi:hypothetical protein